MEKISKRLIERYRSEQQYYLLTTRFNNKTWQENQSFCKKKEYACAYCSPCPLSTSIKTESVMFILEMNNDINRITGIGMLRNIPRKGNIVYEEGNYNRYSFVGKNHLDRSRMDVNEEALMVLLDEKCFKGKGHLKRGQGLTQFPMTVLYQFAHDRTPIQIITQIVEMFKKRK